MKLSKLLLITFAGLLFALIDVTVDTNGRNNIVSAEQLTATAKSYLHKFSHEGAVAFNKMKAEFKDATYDTYMNNGKELAFNMEDQFGEFDN